MVLFIFIYFYLFLFILFIFILFLSYYYFYFFFLFIYFLFYLFIYFFIFLFFFYYFYFFSADMLSQYPIALNENEKKLRLSDSSNNNLIQFMTRAIAIEPHEKSQDDEISLNLYDFILITGKNDQRYHGRCNGNNGYFPKSKVIKLAYNPKSKRLPSSFEWERIIEKSQLLLFKKYFFIFFYYFYLFIFIYLFLYLFIFYFLFLFIFIYFYLSLFIFIFIYFYLFFLSFYFFSSFFIKIVEMKFNLRKRKVKIVYISFKLVLFLLLETQ